MMLFCHCLLSATMYCYLPQRLHNTKSKNAIVPFSVKILFFSVPLGSAEVEEQDKSYSTTCPLGYLAASVLLKLTQNAPLSLAVGDRLNGTWTASQSRLPQKKLHRLTLQFPCTAAQANVLSMNGSARFPRNMACQRATEPNSDRGKKGWIDTVVLLCAAVCLQLSNEALLIQIRVNDYLIIPILQRAPSHSLLCSVKVYD